VSAPTSDRADKLAAFLESLHDKPVTWGRDDCTAAPAAWVEVAIGRHVPVPPYVTKEAAHALIEQAGDLAALWTDVLAKVDLHETGGIPKLGDIGVIELKSMGQVGCIFAAGGVAAIRAETGDGIGSWKWIAPRLRYCRIWALPE